MYAEVLIEYKVKSLDRSFTYEIPEGLRNIIKVGMKVSVPFGQGDSLINGFVTNIKYDSNLGNLKSIVEVTDRELVLNEELMELGKYLRDTTLCTLISAYQTMLPSSLKIKTIKSNFQKVDTYLKLKMPKEFIKSYLEETKGKNQKEILEILLKEEKILKKDHSASTVKTLLTKGLIEEEKVPTYRIDKENAKDFSKVTLTEDQQNCYDEVMANLDVANTYLLHGVTGSGKTEVYMHLIRDLEVMLRSYTALFPKARNMTNI